jgi:hypothetical protein
MAPSTPSPCLPARGEIQTAVRVYLELAYGPAVPAAAAERTPPAGFEPAVWLMSDLVERTPAGVPLPLVRSFALRLGNRHYPHMKLRLALLPEGRGYVFDVDTHDALLAARPDTPDAPQLVEFKRQNAALAAAIGAAWEDLGLPTTKSQLRAAIARLRQAAPAPTP